MLAGALACAAGRGCGVARTRPGAPALDV